jgi:N-acyl-D-aspartate/D-glutamate deacylase
MMADLTVFDPSTVGDVATFADPNRYSVGIKYVLVNGKIVVLDGKITVERPGRVLRGPGYGKASATSAAGQQQTP